MKSKDLDSATTEEIVAELTKRWNEDVIRLSALIKTIEKFSTVRDDILLSIDNTTRFFHQIRLQYPNLKLPNLVLPLNIRFIANPNLTIGDAMEMLLIERGPLTQREIIDELKKGGLKINPKNPHIIIANAVRRDSRKRFKKLKDGRIALEKGKADEPR